MRIETVYLRDFPPFADAQLTFPKVETQEKGELHLLVGQNGTGKTRLLSLLAAALGNRTELDFRSEGDGKNCSIVVGDFGRAAGAWWAQTNNLTWSEKEHFQGHLNLIQNNDTKNIPRHSPSFQNAHNRPAYADPCTALAFRGTSRVSDAEIEAMKPVKVGEQANWLFFEHTFESDRIIGQSMANLKMGAAMESMSAPISQPGRATKIATQLEAAISKVTGRPFYFVVEARTKTVLKVYWGGVPMLLKQLPDGLRSIIGWLVSCVAKVSAIHADHEDPLSLPLILLLDEPESHLHPAWQRRVIPAAQALFPQAQMFVATHSPFVISSANDGWIHVLRANEAGAVTFDEPKPCSKGDTWIDAVEDSLGITEWYDPETEALLKQFRELKAAALSDTPDGVQKYRELAATIAARSDSLSDLMGRELRQFERQIGQKRASA